MLFGWVTQNVTGRLFLFLTPFLHLKIDQSIKKLQKFSRRGIWKWYNTVCKTWFFSGAFKLSKMHSCASKNWKLRIESHQKWPFYFQSQFSMSLISWVFLKLILKDLGIQVFKIYSNKKSTFILLILGVMKKPRAIAVDQIKQFRKEPEVLMDTNFATIIRVLHLPPPANFHPYPLELLGLKDCWFPNTIPILISWKLFQYLHILPNIPREFEL